MSEHTRPAGDDLDRVERFGLPPPRHDGPLAKKLAAMAVHPHADVIARAVVTAAFMFNEDPVASVLGRTHRLGRHLAYYAMMDEFPRCPADALARYVGVKPGREALFIRKAAMSRKVFYWVSEEGIEVVRDAIRHERD